VPLELQAVSAEIEQLISDVEVLKENLLKEATSGFLMDDVLYRRLRMSLLANGTVNALLPGFLRRLRNRTEFWEFMREKFGSASERGKFIREAFDPVLTKLEDELFGGQSPGTIFLSAGSDHDAFVEIRKVVQCAASEILIVDPYVDETMWPLLSNAAGGANIKILTNHMKGDFSVEARKFARQHGRNVEIRGTSAYHDRFIIADSRRCWHLGGSIKDAGSKACLLSELTSSQVVSAIITDVSKAWAAAAVSM
jgi:hypothetical protein